MEADTVKRKIEETVLEILKSSNIEEATEFKIRLSASERLGIDLSDAEHRKFVRTIVENFLLSTTINGNDEDKETVLPAITDTEAHKHTMICEKKIDGEENRVICKLSNKRNVVVQASKGESLVSIREFYHKDGKQLPSSKGISLSADQWSVLRKNIPAIEEAVANIEAKLSPSVSEKPDKLFSVVTTSIPQELIHMKVDRFDGRNYRCWAEQMQLFLKQLNVAYVLSDPCPSDSGCVEGSSQEAVKTKEAVQKWQNDDYICCHNILNSLSDSLFHQYSKKDMHAKEIWEDLKSVYLYKESITKRSQVKKYIEFEIVDGKPIVEQVHEFNCIADSISSNGSFIDENFHVSAVIAKLPPSWKGFCLKIMHVECLPLWMLMDWLRAEEQSRNPDQDGHIPNQLQLNNVNNLGPRMRDIKKPGWQWKRRNSDLDNRGLVCHSCGKKGHIARHCWNKSDKENNVEHNKQNQSTDAVLENNVQQNQMAD